MVVGDSRSEDVYVALSIASNKPADLSVRHQRLDEHCFQHLNNDTGVVFGVCATEIRNYRARMARDKPDVILLACGWLGNAAQQAEAFLDSAGDIPCVLIGPASFADIRSQMYKVIKSQIPEDRWSEFFASNVHYRSAQAGVALRDLARRRQCTYVETIGFLKDSGAAGSGYSLISPDGSPLLIDQTHVTIRGAQILGATFVENEWYLPKSK